MVHAPASLPSSTPIHYQKGVGELFSLFNYLTSLVHAQCKNLPLLRSCCGQEAPLAHRQLHTRGGASISHDSMTRAMRPRTPQKLCCKTQCPFHGPGPLTKALFDQQHALSSVLKPPTTLPKEQDSWASSSQVPCTWPSSCSLPSVHSQHCYKPEPPWWSRQAVYQYQCDVSNITTTLHPRLCTQGKHSTLSTH